MTTPVEVDLRLSYFLKDLVIVPKPGGPETPMKASSRSALDLLPQQ